MTVPVRHCAILAMTIACAACSDRHGASAAPPVVTPMAGPPSRIEVAYNNGGGRPYQTNATLTITSQRITRVVRDDSGAITSNVGAELSPAQWRDLSAAFQAGGLAVTPPRPHHDCGGAPMFGLSLAWPDGTTRSAMSSECGSREIAGDVPAFISAAVAYLPAPPPDPKPKP